jgi:fumarate reductase flavoprotein subunit
MAGLCAAARARELGASPVVLEKGDRPGGSMLLSSGFVWRYRTFDEFRAQCPGGDPALQRLVFERLDGALDWLESLGAQAVERDTGNPLTVGRRFEPRALTELLVSAAGDVRLGTALPDEAETPLVLATGGFPARLARELGLPLRANRWSDGGAIDFARRRGGALTRGLDEFFGRAMPDVPVAEEDFVRLAQVYGRHALAIVDDRGREFVAGSVSWSETDLVQAIARRPGGAAWFVLDAHGLDQPVRARTVRELVEAARAAGGTVRKPAELPFSVPRDAVLAVRVRAAVTHTIGGLRIDDRAGVLRDDGARIEGLYAAGVDAGGWSTGGYASGLATALVLGLVSAEDAVASESK